MRTCLAALAVCLSAPGAGLAAPYRQPVPSDVIVTAYFDHGGRDWACGDVTYGGHRGTDIAIIGRFEAQDQGRDIVAAQAGRVTQTHEGEFDRCTTADCGGGGGFGNFVYLQHADGQITIYGHMRQGSVRVAVGQDVNCGDVIGQVGSSGNSTGPHLHFEVRVNGGPDDPFAGECGGPLSYWVNQGGHRALPTADCDAPPPPPPPPPPPMRPDMHLAFEFGQAAGLACDFDECRDFIRDGQSGGIFDAWIGEPFEIRVTVSNQGDGATNGESPEDSAATLQYELPGGLTPIGYAITTDWPARDRQTWVPNDAQQNPANPAADAPPAAGELRLNPFGPGESKRVTLTVRANASTVHTGAHQSVRAWIKHVKGYYGEKTGWDDGAEVNDGQSYNGGDLKVQGELDVFDPTAFLFESPDGAMIEGWRRCAPDAVGSLAVNTTDHALAAEVLAAAPCIEGPRVRVPLADFAGVRLSGRQHQSQRQGVLQWTTEAEPEFDAARSVTFDTSGGGQFDALHLAMPWDRAAILTRLRLLPVPDAGSGNAFFDLGEIRLTADAPPGPGEDPAPGAGGTNGNPPDAEPDPDDGVPPVIAPGSDQDGGPGTPGDPAGPNGAGGEGRYIAEEDRKLTYDGGCAQAPGHPQRSGLLAAFAVAGLALRRRRPSPPRT